MTESDKRSSLLRYGINYDSKKVYSTGPGRERRRERVVRTLELQPNLIIVLCFLRGEIGCVCFERGRHRERENERK